jgi:hypothetical protein
LPEVQATLGHGNISTTSGYLHARPDSSSGLVLDPECFFDEDDAQGAIIKQGRDCHGMRQRWSSSRRTRKRPITLAPVPSLNRADQDEISAQGSSAKDEAEG